MLRLVQTCPDPVTSPSVTRQKATKLAVKDSLVASWIFRSREVLLITLYKALVKSHLEYCCPVSKKEREIYHYYDEEQCPNNQCPNDVNITNNKGSLQRSHQSPAPSKYQSKPTTHRHTVTHRHTHRHAQQTYTDMYVHTHSRHTQTYTDRQTYRQTYRHGTHGHTQTPTHRHTQTDKQTHTATYTHRDTEKRQLHPL